MIRLFNPPRQDRYATLALSGHRSAQGPVIREYRDGRVMIDTGTHRLTGLPLGTRAPSPALVPLFFGM